LFSVAAHADPRPFSLYGLAGWEEKTFLRHAHTEYRATQDGRIQVIEANCEDSASGLIWRDHIDLAATPILAWRWKVESLYPGLNERAKGGDDFPARVYAIRSGGALWWKTRTIMYVWSNGEQGVDDWSDPYTNDAHVVPVRIGGDGVGEWQTERRDLREDFKKFFGLELTSLDGVALMSDCDDHHGKGHAWYGDIRLLAP
jgi:hypothetical protein